jgi:hypothetical protein
MRIFKKRNRAGTQPAFWLMQLRTSMDKRQGKIAAYLGRKTQYWNRNSWLIALALFILLFGGCCLLLCIKAFIH